MISYFTLENQFASKKWLRKRFKYWPLEAYHLALLMFAFSDFFFFFLEIQRHFWSCSGLKLAAATAHEIQALQCLVGLTSWQFGCWLSCILFSWKKLITFLVLGYSFHKFFCEMILLASSVIILPNVFLSTLLSLLRLVQVTFLEGWPQPMAVGFLLALWHSYNWEINSLHVEAC